MPPEQSGTPAWVGRLQALALPIFGGRRVMRARSVVDRYNLAGGGLLAAGIAYNTLFAIIPMALFGGAILGFIVSDPSTLANVRAALTDWAPPLASVIDEILTGLSTASPSLSVIGVLGMIWGATRLFASLEEGIEAMFSEAPRRGLVSRTLRRVTSIVVVAAVVALALVGTSIASFVSELSVDGNGVVRGAIPLLLLVLPLVLTALALATVYRLVPPVQPAASAIVPPAIVVGIGLVLLTRLFASLAPRFLGANFVYGTLGAIFVALAWLGLAYSLILIGAAWVRERMLAADDSTVAEETAAVV